MEERSKVLVVDDVAINRFLIDDILDTLDVELIHAGSGADALRMVAEHDFAVILMDIYMPEMDGIETTTRIHERKGSENTPVLMLTAADENDDFLLPAYNAGAVDYVTKPITPVVLFNKVNQFIHLKRQCRLAELAEIKQTESNTILQTLLNSAGEGILGLDIDGVITFVNPKAIATFGYESPDLMGKHIKRFLSVEHCEGAICDGSGWESSQLYKHISSEKSGHCDNERWQKENGDLFNVEYSIEPIEDAGEGTAGCVVMFQDITDRKVAEENLKYLASFDSLTKLANRPYFYDSLDKAIVRSRRSQAPLSVLMLDLDHFKFINDTYGHDGGDVLLKKVSERLVGSVRECDLVARLGGDEFAVILYDVYDLSSATQVAKNIIENVSQDVDLGVATINVSCSIGVAMFSDYSWEMDDLVKCADTALYEAKEQGRNNYQVFVADMRKDMIEKQRIQRLLQRAIVDDELFLVFQPKISLSSKKITGCEALLRWTSQDEGFISPALFIPISEESGQIIEIGEWVLSAACQQVQQWQKQGFENFSVSINVSTRQLRSGSFYDQVKINFDKYDIIPSMVEFEVTETCSLENQEMVVAELNKLHALGVTIAIDDFGTGSASLEYLRKLSLDVLKIDRSFIKDIGTDLQDEEIIRVMMAISKTMDLSVVAEGAETVEQLVFLAGINCDIIQGYYFSQPISAEDMTRQLNDFDEFYSEKFECYHRYLSEAAGSSNATKH